MPSLKRPVAVDSTSTPERFQKRKLDLTVEFLWRIAQQQNDDLKPYAESDKEASVPSASVMQKVKKLNLHLRDARIGKVNEIRNVSPSGPAALPTVSQPLFLSS